MKLHIGSSFTLGALLLLTGQPLAQASPAAVAAVLEAAKKSQVADHLDHLVNRIGPRLTSSDNLTNAGEWAKAKFESFGLRARLEEWGTFPVGFNRGPWSGRMTKPETLEFEFKTDAWTAGTKGRVKGAVLPMPKSPDAAAALGDQAKGAWFLVTGAGFFGPRVNQRMTKALIAAGAGGLITRNRSLLVTGGNQRVRWEDLPTLPRVDLRPDHYGKLRDLVEQGKEVEVEFDIRNYFKQGPIKLYNVIAELTGSEHPDEYVIVGGHLDSWDGATGTTDNGTGVATTLEAARLLTAAGARPLRTIRFMLWGGEEQGLLGSKAFIASHPEENARISAVLVHDGGTNYVAGIAGLAAMLPQLEQAFQPVIDAGLQYPFKVSTLRSFMPIGSDHDAYLAKGVPGFFWRQSGSANYTHTHHTQFDTYDTANQDYQKHTSIVAALGALGIANLPAKLSRDGFRYVGRRMRVPNDANAGRRVLGVMTDDSATITNVMEGYPAQRVGLQVGDQIVKIGDTSISKSEDVGPALQRGGKMVQLVVKRAAKEIGYEVAFER